MAISGDVRKSDGSKGPLAGKSVHEIYAAHHNLNDETGELLPGFTQHQGKGCECDHCQEFLTRAKAEKEVAA